MSDVFERMTVALDSGRGRLGDPPSVTSAYGGPTKSYIAANELLQSDPAVRAAFTGLRDLTVLGRGQCILWSRALLLHPRLVAEAAAAQADGMAAYAWEHGVDPFALCGLPARAQSVWRDANDDDDDTQALRLMSDYACPVASAADLYIRRWNSTAPIDDVPRLIASGIGLRPYAALCRAGLKTTDAVLAVYRGEVPLDYALNSQ